MFDVLVIGAGMFGSAATRYLAEAGAHVGLVGPDEPENHAAHNDVFSSHYDMSRIFRTLDKDYIWGQLAKSSQESFLELQNRSESTFLNATGFLRADWDEELHTSVLRNGDKLVVDYFQSDVATLRLRYPYLQISEEAYCVIEGDGGYLDPRKLIEIQIEQAEQHGADRIFDTVHEVNTFSDRVEIRTKAGHRYIAGRLLIATGGFTNCFPLTRHQLDLEVLPETVLLVPVNRMEWAIMKDMPAIWYEFEWHSRFPYVYIVPPVVYPDGRMYLKIGADYDRDVSFDGFEDYRRFFQGTGSEETGQALREVVARIFPDLKGRKGILKPCMLTYTASGYPYIDQVESRVFIALGGCGQGAKASDEIGKIAARLVEYRGWSHELPAKYFRSSLVKRRAIGL